MDRVTAIKNVVSTAALRFGKRPIKEADLKQLAESNGVYAYEVLDAMQLALFEGYFLPRDQVKELRAKRDGDRVAQRVRSYVPSENDDA